MCLLGSLLLSCGQVNIKALAADENFLIKPYLQLGYDYRGNDEELVWFSNNDKTKWEVLCKPQASAKDKTTFQPVQQIKDSIITIPGQNQTPFHKYTARLNTPAGETFEYKVKANGSEVFSASGIAPRKADQAYKIVVFGDCGSGSDGQRRLAEGIAACRPDLVVITGDIVYQHGLFSQYLTNYFPVYNQQVGLLRSIPTVGVLGNHDIALGGRGTNLDRYPDALAYYLLWNQPLNGFAGASGEKNTTILTGADDKQELFKKSAGAAFPKMANFSFDYGNSHWVVLDGNYYMDWTDAKARKWLNEDLKASKATWKFVTFHQPAFSIDAPHGKEQRMRLVSDILQANGVDLVLCGHAHCYERSLPLNFGPEKNKTALSLNADGTVDGAFSFDKTFDGTKNTSKKGIIHIVTGAGGARLYPQGEASEFILKFDSNSYSFTEMQIKGKTLTVKQIDDSGKILDQFTVSK